MKKLIIYIFIIPVLLLLPISCDDALDVNTDPLAATSADPNAVLPYVFTQYSNRKTTELGTRIIDVPQYFSATFNSPVLGSTTIFLTGNTWGMYYTLILGNLLLLENDATLAGPTSNNIAAIAKIMSALSFYELAVIWDDVPFSEALDGVNFPNPNFDKQEAVLKGTLTMLDAGIQLIDNMPATGNFDLSSGDLVYGGDMSNWRRFANSLKLRILLLIRNRDTSVDSEIVATFSQPLIENVSHIAQFKYPGGAGGLNAWKNILVAFSGSGTNAGAQFFGAAPVFRNLLTSNNDPRTTLFMVDLSGADLYDSPAMGSFPGATSTIISDNMLRGDLPDTWFLPAELTLMRAELILKGVLSGDADVEFRKGVDQAVRFWGQDVTGIQMTLTDAEISTFVASFPDLNAMAPAAALILVHEQQYLDFFLRPIVSWNHVRRTKVPTMELVPGSNITTILKRFNYPPNEVGANPNTPTNLVTDVPVWFEN